MGRTGGSFFTSHLYTCLFLFVCTLQNLLIFKISLLIFFLQNNTTYTGALSGDVYIWSTNSLVKIVKQVHSGPVFTMFTTVKDGLIVTGGKDKGYILSVIKVFIKHLKRLTVIYEFFEFFELFT